MIDPIEYAVRVMAMTVITLAGFALIVELRHRRQRRQWAKLVKNLERQAQAEIVRQQRARFGLTEEQVEQYKRDMGYDF